MSRAERVLFQWLKMSIVTKRAFTVGIAVACIVVGLGCGRSGIAAPTTVTTSLRLDLIAEGLQSPVFLTSPSGDSRLFVVEQGGRIRIVAGGTLLAAPFIDLTNAIASGGERGLLSVAFHPKYATNGLFYVYFTNPGGDIRIVRYHASPSANVADAASGDTVLAIAHPQFSNHNGGLVTFGADGKLFLGTGDGGGGGDVAGNSQNKRSLLGKLLRLDVDVGHPYSIPSDNPFAHATDARPEIWAYGLRNPWRFALDRQAALWYIGDVGQDKWEEIDVAPVAAGGLNYGWNLFEATHCYATTPCSAGSTTLPVLEYGHDAGCAVVGGYVYRGRRMPDLDGTYFYSDWCSGWLKSFRYSGGTATAPKDWGVSSVGTVLSFGEDAVGELYVLTGDGRVMRIGPV